MLRAGLWGESAGGQSGLQEQKLIVAYKLECVILICYITGDLHFNFKKVSMGSPHYKVTLWKIVFCTCVCGKSLQSHLTLCHPNGL